MLFHSLPFLAFLGLAFAAYWAVAKWKWPRLTILMVASLAFYAAWTPLPLLVFFWIALVDHLCVQGMAPSGAGCGSSCWR